MIQALPDGAVLGDARQPPDESNIGQSALFIPLSRISEELRGRKIRIIGQILAYDVKSCVLLLAAQSAGFTPLETLLVDLKVPMLDCSNPAITDIPLHDYDLAPPPSTPYSEGLINRERLRLERGGWVTVVGWVEGRPAKRLQVPVLKTYAKPPSVMLEAIHIANARPPPIGAIYRGDIPQAPAIDADADFDTPRPRRRAQPT